MDCYRLVLLPVQQVDIERLSEVWRNSGCACEKIKNDVESCCNCSIKSACIDLYSEEDTSKWKSLNVQDSHKVLKNNVEEVLSKRKAELDDLTSIDNPAKAIHQLTNHVPYNGLVTVAWFFPPTPNMVIRSQMEMFGALYRLVEWHHAKIYLICEDIQDNEIIAGWVEMLHATVISSTSTLAPSMWSGSIVISGTKSCLNLGGISMSRCKNDDISLLANAASEKKKIQSKYPTIMSSKMEIVAAVPLAQIPVFYISNRRVVFHITSDSTRFQTSREFFKVLREDPEVCYIARLNYGESIKKHPKKDTSWQDAVIQQPSKLSDLVETVELDSISGCHHFLLYGIQDNEEGCMAAILHSTSSLNGHVMQKLALKDLENAPASEFFEQVKEWVQSAPCASADHIVKTERVVQQAQIAVLSAWIDEQRRNGKDASLSTDELLSLLELTRVELMKGSTLWSHQPMQSELPVVYPLPKIATELQDDSSSQVELVALKLKEMSQIEKGLLPPPGKNQQVTLDAAEFLKLFNKDGTAATSDLEPILRQTSPSKRLLRLNSNEKICRTESWPTCFSNDAHGKHYHNGEEAEKLEKVCNKLKTRLQPIETAGFFSSPSASIAACKVKATVRRTVSACATPTKNKRLKSATKSPGLKRSKSVLVARKKSPKVLTPNTSANKSRTPDVNRSSEKTVSSASRSAKSASGSADSSQKTQLKGTEQEKRSQRHKRKLEETVRKTLEKHNVMTGDPIFKSASQKLFDLVKCYLKGLKTSHNLRQEMETLAELHAAQVIAFEKKYR